MCSNTDEELISSKYEKKPNKSNYDKSITLNKKNDTVKKKIHINFLSYSNIKHKILKLSNSYIFYKTNYEKLLATNTDLNNQITYLKKENIKLKKSQNTILANQKKIMSSLNVISSVAENQNSKIDDVLSSQEINNEKVMSSLNVISSVAENQNSKIDDVLSSQEINNEKLTDIIDKNNDIKNMASNNNQIISLINEASLRIEKSSTMSNLKISSKFNDNYRLIESLFNDLDEKITKNTSQTIKNDCTSSQDKEKL